MMESGSKKIVDVRGWLEIREELTSEIMAFLDFIDQPETKPPFESEQKKFIQKGWSCHPVDHGNSYFFSYLFYGGNFQERSLSYFKEVVQWLAKEMNYWDGPLRVYPTGEFVLEEGEGEWIQRWRIEEGQVIESPVERS